MFKEIKKSKKLYMLIVEQIEALLQDGSLAQGDKLPSERELSIQFGLSRSSVREAITALEIMGLVEVQPGLGTFISSGIKNGDKLIIKYEILDDISPTEIFEARMLIEPNLAKLAAKRATLEDLEEIRKNIEQAELLNDDEFELFEQLDGQFHLLIAKASYNEVLYKFAENLSNLRNSTLWGNLKLKSIKKDGRVSKYKLEHREIYDLMTSRDLNKVELKIKKHLTDIKKDLFEENN